MKTRGPQSSGQSNRRIRATLLRFALYGFAGLAAEVGFYNLVKFGRLVPGIRGLFEFGWRVDPKLNLGEVWNAAPIALYGQASLWMFLVYAGACLLLVEPIYRNTRHAPVALRGLCYGLAILCWEAATGWLLARVVGYRIWYYDDALNVLGTTSLAIGPIWCITGLIVERIYRRLMHPRLVAALRTRGFERSIPAPSLAVRHSDGWVHAYETSKTPSGS